MRLSEKIETTTGHIELALLELKFMTGDFAFDIETKSMKEEELIVWSYYINACLGLECALHSLQAITKARKHKVIC